MLSYKDVLLKVVLKIHKYIVNIKVKNPIKLIIGAKSVMT